MQGGGGGLGTGGDGGGFRAGEGGLAVGVDGPGPEDQQKLSPSWVWITRLPHSENLSRVKMPYVLPVPE